MGKLKIEVTWEDIEKGTPSNDKQCPIALSLIRQGYTDVAVGGSIRFTDKSTGIKYAANQDIPIMRFIFHFDHNIPYGIIPFETEILYWERKLTK